jgi:hypothetical protein
LSLKQVLLYINGNKTFHEYQSLLAGGQFSRNCPKTIPMFCLRTDFMTCLRTVISYISLCSTKKPVLNVGLILIRHVLGLPTCLAIYFMVHVKFALAFFSFSVLKFVHLITYKMYKSRKWWIYRKLWHLDFLAYCKNIEISILTYVCLIASTQINSTLMNYIMYIL